MTNGLINELIAASPNRRSLLKSLGIAAAVAGSSLSFATRSVEAQSTTDIDLLNFALNLEYLQAEFYTQAATGASITLFGVRIDGRATGSNPPSGGTAVGGKQVSFFSNDSFTLDIVAEIATNERAHVTLLRNALGSAAVARPNLNLNALGFGFDSEHDLLRASRILEDIGLTAYTGSIGMLRTPDNITLAGRLLGAEAEHAAGVRTQIARLGITSKALDALDRVPPPAGSSNSLLSTDSRDGLVATRTIGQVLNLVLGARSGGRSGGFFPSGFNGANSFGESPAPVSARP
jgi:hypothetical protein